MNEGNVVAFPGEYRGPLQISENIIEMKMANVEDAVEYMTSMVFHELSMMGYNRFENPEIAEKCASLLCESITSYCALGMGIFHPFQELADVAFNFTEDGHVNLTDSIRFSVATPKKTRNKKSKKNDVTASGEEVVS